MVLQYLLTKRKAYRNCKWNEEERNDGEEGMKNMQVQAATNEILKIGSVKDVLRLSTPTIGHIPHVRSDDAYSVQYVTCILIYL